MSKSSRKTQGLVYVAAFSSAIVAAGAIYVAAHVLGVPIKILTRDPYRAAEVPPYVAYFSLLGSTIWLAASSATLTTGFVAARLLRCRLSDTSPYRIIVLGGIIGSIMALDDILLFHDAVAEALGFPERIFHVFYLLFMVSMILYSRDVLRRTPWAIFFAALAFFGLSSVVDLWRSLPEALDQSEDVFKFCAIVLWAIYFVYVSWAFVEERGAGRVK